MGSGAAYDSAAYPATRDRLWGRSESPGTPETIILIAKLNETKLCPIFLAVANRKKRKSQKHILYFFEAIVSSVLLVTQS